MFQVGLQLVRVLGCTDSDQLLPVDAEVDFVPGLPEGGDRIKYRCGQRRAGISGVSGAYLKARIDLDRLQSERRHARGLRRRRDPAAAAAVAGSRRDRRIVRPPSALVYSNTRNGTPITCLAGDSLVHLAHEAEAEGGAW